MRICKLRGEESRHWRYQHLMSRKPVMEREGRMAIGGETQGNLVSQKSKVGKEYSTVY